MKKKHTLAAMIIGLLVGSSFSSFASETPLLIDTPTAIAETVKNGWVQEENGYWRYYEQGSMQTGWHDVDGITYFFYPDGVMATGESDISGKAYTFSDQGAFLYQGIHRDGLEDDLLTAAWENTIRYQDEIMDHIRKLNEYRIENNRKPLTYDRDLCVIAGYRSLHMHKYDYFSHRYHDVSQVRETGQHYYGYKREYGENIFRIVATRGTIGYPDLYAGNDDSLDSFKSSPGHNYNLLNTISSGVGIGYCINSDYTYLALTQVFD